MSNLAIVKDKEIEYTQWYMMADVQEVYNVLNSIAMEFESYHYINEEIFQHSVRQYDYDEETFHKAEALWQSVKI